MTYISSSSLLAPLRSSVQQTQAALAKTQNEIASGAPDDLGLSLGANTGYLLSLRSQSDRLQAFTTTNGVATTRLSATNNVLGNLGQSAQTMLTSLLTAQSSGSTATTLPTTAASALATFVAQLNTTVGNQSIFGGINTAQAPIAAYSTAPPSATKAAIDTSFSQQFGAAPGDAAASSISGASMQTYLDTQFAPLFATGAWQGSWSGATDQVMSSAIAPGQTATTSVSANETAFRQLAQAYAMVSAFSGTNLGSDAQQAVVSTASKLVSAGLAGLTALQTTVGQTQNQITTANAQVASQTDVLKANTVDLDGVDSYALSAKLTQLQTQLQSSYELTSSLKSLSLTNYLMSG